MMLGITRQTLSKDQGAGARWRAVIMGASTSFSVPELDKRGALA